MVTYLVGTLAQEGAEYADFLFQTTNVSVVATRHEGKDHRGNLKASQHNDHRLRVRVTALIPRDVALPVPGQVVQLSGITVPTIDAAGNVTSGDLQVTDPDTAESGSGAAAALDFEVTGEPQIEMSNEALTSITFEAERALINSLPAAESSGA